MIRPLLTCIPGSLGKSGRPGCQPFPYWLKVFKAGWLGGWVAGRRSNGDLLVAPFRRSLYHQQSMKFPLVTSWCWIVYSKEWYKVNWYIGGHVGLSHGWEIVARHLVGTLGGYDLVRHLVAGPAGVIVQLGLDLLDNHVATGGDHLLEIWSRQ